MHFCGSPSRYMTVGYLIFSRLCLQSEGNREALVNSAGGELWVLEYVSWLKKKYEVGDHQLVNVLENQRDTPEEKHVSVRGNFRSVRLHQDKATTAPCKSVMSELSHLVTIYPDPTWPKEWRSREGEIRDLAEMDTSALPGRFPGPQQGRGRHWIGWIWDGADTWLTWTCETQSDRMYGMAARWCRKWGSVECGWRQPLEEEEPVHICICYGLSLCIPQKFHMMKSWFPSIGGAFVKWWIYKDGASSMRWPLIYIRDTQSSQALPHVRI